MAIRLTNGAEFLHIPKTGGSWVEKALDSCNLIQNRFGHKHADFQRVVNHGRFDNWSLLETFADASLRRTYGMIGFEKLAKRPAEAFRFCFVRHPLTWYESWWRYNRKRGWPVWGQVDCPFDWHPNAALNGLGNEDFNEFVWNVIRKRPGYVTELYYSFVGSNVAFVGRMETLADDLISVLSQQGIAFDVNQIRSLDKVNTSTPEAVSIEWDPKLKKTVTALELPALTYFGYLSDDDIDAFGLDGRTMNGLSRMANSCI